MNEFWAASLNIGSDPCWWYGIGSGRVLVSSFVNTNGRADGEGVFDDHESLKSRLFCLFHVIVTGNMLGKLHGMAGQAGPGPL